MLDEQVEHGLRRIHRGSESWSDSPPDRAGVRHDTRRPPRRACRPRRRCCDARRVHPRLEHAPSPPPDGSGTAAGIIPSPTAMESTCTRQGCLVDKPRQPLAGSDQQEPRSDTPWALAETDRADPSPIVVTGRSPQTKPISASRDQWMLGAAAARSLRGDDPTCAPGQYLGVPRWTRILVRTATVASAGSSSSATSSVTGAALQGRSRRRRRARARFVAADQPSAVRDQGRGSASVAVYLNRAHRGLRDQREQSHRSTGGDTPRQSIGDDVPRRPSKYPVDR